MPIRSQNDDVSVQSNELVAIADRLIQRGNVVADVYEGTVGDDKYKGTASSDSFDMSQGGKDSVSADDGNDTIVFGAAFTSADRVNAGNGFDTLTLDGDYAAGFSLDRTSNIESYIFRGGSYVVTGIIDERYSALGTIDASTLSADQTLNLDCTSGSGIKVIGGAGADVVKVTTTYDVLTLSGGDGNDVLIGDNEGHSFNEGVHFDGGRGADRIEMLNDAYGNVVEYHSVKDSTKKAFDTIVGFQPAVNTFLLDFDSDTTTDGVQRGFHFKETAEHVGDILFHYDAKADETIVQVFTDHDAKADFVVHLAGELVLQSYNFVF